MTELEEVGQQGFDLMELVNGVITFILLNMLWLVCSLLIVTLPAATAALFAALAPWGRGQSPSQPLANFFVAMKQYGLKATALALLDLLAGGFISLNLLILRQMGVDSLMGLSALTATLAAAILLVVANVYAWPLLVVSDLSLRDLLSKSVRLGIMHPFWGLLIAVTAALPVLVSFFLPGFFLLTITFAAPALITQWGAYRVIRRYALE